MRFFTLTFALFCLFQTTGVFGQTPPSVSDTIELNFDTIALPKRGPNFSNYYGSGQKLFATRQSNTATTNLNVYESLDFGGTWRLKLENIIDFNATDSVIIYSQYISGRQISANGFTGYEGSYKIFASTDGGNSFDIRNTNSVQSYYGTRSGCSDGYNHLQRLNDSVLIYGIDKHCEMYHPTGLWVSPYAEISKNNGQTWSYGSYTSIPDFIIDKTAFKKNGNFLFFTQQADFQYTDSINLSFNLPYGSVIGRSFVAGVYAVFHENGVVYSTNDKGQTWQTDTLPFRISVYNFQLIQDKNTIFLMGRNALYRADNGDLRHFKHIYPQFPNNRTEFSALSIGSSSIYFNGADRVLLRSIDGGNIWKICNNNEGDVGYGKLYGFGEDMWFYDKDYKAIYHFEDTNPVTRLDTFPRNAPDFSSNKLGFKKDSLYLIGNTSGKMLRSHDKGFTWKNVPIGHFNVQTDSNNLYGITGFTSFVVSNDNGNSFSTYEASERLDELIIKKNKMWAILGELNDGLKLKRSLDSGRTWVTIFRSSIQHSPAYFIIEGQDIWLLTTSGHLYKSTDEGITWTQISSGLNIYYPQMMRKRGYLFIYSASVDEDISHIFISKNEGLTWTRVNNSPNVLMTDKYIYTSATAFHYGYNYPLKVARFQIDSLANKIKSDKTYSLLRGQVLKDKNMNCREDTVDTAIPYKMLRFNQNITTSTDQDGRFSIMLPIDTYAIEIADDRYFTLRCPNDTLIEKIILRPFQTTERTFFFQKTKAVRDIAVTLTANGRPRPANELEFILNLKNVGTETADSLTVQFDFRNMPVQLVSASPNAVLNGQKLTWFRRNFLSDADELLRVSLRIDTFAPRSTNLRFYAQTDILNEIDTFPSDNRDSTRLIVVGSYDPNDKSVLPDGKIPLSASIDTFDYTIRFQNTGTDTAYKVVILDTLPTLLDPYSLRIKSSSHSYQLNVNKNVLIFTFDKIMLPDSFTNERASHGFIRYTVNPKNRLAKGETLDNRAHIFFDYNPAIMTNTAQNDVYKPTIQTQQNVTLCEGDSWKNVIYKRSTIRIDTLQKPLVDLVHTTFITVNPTFSMQIDTTIRLGDTLFGRRLEVNEKIVFPYRTVFGCDSSIVYNVRVEKANKTSDLALSKINISVAPNPTNDWLSITYNLNEPLETEIYLINSLGQKLQIIKQKAFDTEGVHTIRLDVRNFAAGMYQVILQTPYGRKTINFSKI